MEGTLDASYKSIVESTRLLTFFATPHRGGNYASVGSVAAKIVRASLQKPNNDLLNALKQSCDDTTRRFEQSRHLYEKCLVISFFEGLPLGTLGVVRGHNLKCRIKADFSHRLWTKRLQP